MENFMRVLFIKDNEVIALCGIMVIFFAVLAFYQAIKYDIEKSRQKPDDETTPKPKADKIDTWPYLVRKEFLVAIAVTIGLIVWGLVTDAPLEEYANSNVTPNPSKAPWYFLGLQEMLVYFDPWIAGVMLPVLIIGGLMAIPYIDVNPKGNGYYTFRERIFAISTYCFGFIILWIFLIIVGVFLRGPGWLIFMPWQEWDTHRIVADTNYDLTVFIGIDSRSILGMMIGGIVCFIYYAVIMAVPYYFLRKSPTVVALGIVRYIIVSFLFASMMSLPIKIFLKLTFHLKYIWATPWFNF
ncbi:MAG: cytochrome C [Candidatus Brocadiales bacterium]